MKRTNIPAGAIVGFNDPYRQTKHILGKIEADAIATDAGPKKG